MEYDGTRAIVSTSRGNGGQGRDGGAAKCAVGDYVRATPLVTTTILSVGVAASGGSCASPGDVLGTQLAAVEAAGGFRGASGRWPESEAELRRAAAQDGSKLGPEHVTLTPQPDGRLLIHV